MSEKSLDQFGKADLSKLGFYLKQRRKAAGLTVRRLSELSGVSAGSIRALEDGKSSPSLLTVFGVVDVLGLSIDGAIEASQMMGKRVVVKRQVADGLANQQSLSDGIADPQLKASVFDILPGVIEPVPNEAEHGPCICMVVNGEIIASLDNAKRVPLSSGDTYHAQAGRVRSWANAGDIPARLICVVDETRRDGNITPSGESA